MLDNGDVRGHNFINIVKTSQSTDDQLSRAETLKNPPWREAIQEEFDSLISNSRWELVKLPEGKQVFSSKWSFKPKPQLDDISLRLKARLVARRLEQKHDIDYNETFVHIVQWSTLRALISLSVALRWEVHHMDIIIDFLNGKQQEKFYMK